MGAGKGAEKLRKIYPTAPGEKARRKEERCGKIL